MKPRLSLAKNRGASLIEVLITTFVFGTGVLGMAGLQVVSKKTNYDAIQHTQAGMLAFSVLEKMRANPVCLAEYLTNDLADDVAQYSVPDCATGACVGEPLARFDLIKWNEGLQGNAEVLDGVSVGGIAEPTACITGPANGDSGLYTVAIAWRGITPQAQPDEFDADDPRSNSCGADKSAYDDAVDPEEDDGRLRRLLVMQAYISNPGGSCGV